MPNEKPQVKENVACLMAGARVVFYYGFIPTVLLLGFMKGADKGAPPLTLMSLLWQ